MLGYIGFVDCPTGLGIGPAELEPPAVARNRRKAAAKKNEESSLKVRCHERDYTPNVQR